MVPEPKETAQALLGCSPPSDLLAKESRPDEPGLAYLLGLGENLFVFQISEAKLEAPRESLFSVGRAGTCDKQARQWPSRELWAQGCDSGGCCLGFAVAEPPPPFHLCTGKDTGPGCGTAQEGSFVEQWLSVLLH